MLYKAISLALAAVLLHSSIAAQDQPQFPPQTVAKMQQVLHKAQEKDKVVKVILNKKIDEQRKFSGKVLSVVHGFLGEEDEAITILERLFEERLPALVYLNGRTYAPLRGSPRFRNLTARIGLPQPLRQG